MNGTHGINTLYVAFSNIVNWVLGLGIQVELGKHAEGSSTLVDVHNVDCECPRFSLASDFQRDGDFETGEVWHKSSSFNRIGSRRA